MKLNDTIDNFQLNHKVQLETSKTKLNETQMHLDEHSLNLANEKNNNKNLQLSVSEKLINWNLIKVLTLFKIRLRTLKDRKKFIQIWLLHLRFELMNWTHS